MKIEVKVTFLHPSWHSPFSFPSTYVLWIPSTNVECKGSPYTQTDHPFALPECEKKKIGGHKTFALRINLSSLLPSAYGEIRIGTFFGANFL